MLRVMIHDMPMSTATVNQKSQPYCTTLFQKTVFTSSM